MDRLYYERISALALNRIFGFEPQISARLIEATGSAAAVFALSRQELSDLFGPYTKYRNAISRQELDRSDQELTALERDGYRFISRTEEDFPALLKECPDCPAGLYIRSSSEIRDIFRTRPAIAVVGTRDISPYGRDWCPRIVGAMAGSSTPPTIVSGLAFGVDISAHMAAIAQGIPTIAVIPTGITDIYPRTHRIAAEKIASAPGSAIITDYPPGTMAQKVNFLRRNRIIAGMSSGTILVESKAKGGGTMTARLASSYGRDLYALPGRIDDVRSEGCNLLIAEKIAEPIADLDAMVRGLGLGVWKRRAASDLEKELLAFYDRNPAEEAPEALAATALLIKKHRGITPEELCRLNGLPYARTAALTSILERDGFVQMDLLQQCVIKNKFT